LGIVQIASRLVRRIVPYVSENQDVAQGQRIGVIRFGSQVDLLLPKRAGLEVVVEVGDEVTAGETVLVLQRKPQSVNGGSGQLREVERELVEK
jgi:phosphatidylserine decarboxylase